MEEQRIEEEQAALNADEMSGDVARSGDEQNEPVSVK